MAKNTARPKTLADCAAERGLKALWGALDAVYPQSRAAKNWLS